MKAFDYVVILGGGYLLYKLFSQAQPIASSASPLFSSKATEIIEKAAIAFESSGTTAEKKTALRQAETAVQRDIVSKATAGGAVVAIPKTISQIQSGLVNPTGYAGYKNMGAPSKAIGGQKVSAGTAAGNFRVGLSGISTLKGY